jgi:hypothetical protein
VRREAVLEGLRVEVEPVSNDPGKQHLLFLFAVSQIDQRGQRTNEAVQLALGPGSGFQERLRVPLQRGDQACQDAMISLHGGKNIHVGLPFDSDHDFLSISTTRRDSLQFLMT